VPLAAKISVSGVWWRVSRSGQDPLFWTAVPADGRWQRSSVVRGLYLSDSEETAWAEWYRHTSEMGVPPQWRMPRDTWRLRVDVADVGDLHEIANLAPYGITELVPTMRQWPATQPVGEAHFRAGHRAILTPSAAHVGGQVLTIFRPDVDVPGVVAVQPGCAHFELPPLPTGLRT
jgi:RES domain-containing protein